MAAEFNLGAKKAYYMSAVNPGIKPVPAPTITNISPLAGTVGSQVVIVGTNFRNVQGVSFAGVPAAGYSVDSDTRITANVPTGAQTGVITVATATGQASSGAVFTVTNGSSGGTTESAFPYTFDFPLA